MNVFFILVHNYHRINILNKKTFSKFNLWTGVDSSSLYGHVRKKQFLFTPFYEGIIVCVFSMVMTVPCFYHLRREYRRRPRSRGTVSAPRPSGARWSRSAQAREFSSARAHRHRPLWTRGSSLILTFFPTVLEMICFKRWIFMFTKGFKIMFYLSFLFFK